MMSAPIALSGRDAQVLQDAVVDDRERRAGLDVGEENQSAVASRTLAIFLLRANALVLALVDDVGFHADGEVAAGRAAFHRAPLVELLRVAGRDTDVDARAAHRFGPKRGRGTPI